MLVTGAAGFIGSHLVDRLLHAGHSVLGIDNFRRGSRQHLSAALPNSRFQFKVLDLNNLDQYRDMLARVTARQPIDLVWHFAANSDIAAGVSDPQIDLRDTFLTTFHTLLLMRESSIRQIAFPSTSAVYGDNPAPLSEDTGPLLPISNYGAMKLASEASISAAAESFLERAWIFRFPNVVGPRATHGIIFDLLRKLAANPDALEVLGDGSQQKPYLHVSELLDAMLFIQQHAVEKRNCFNIGPEDDGTTVRFIADTVVNVAAPGKPIHYTGGNKGWVGDVSRFRYSIEKLNALGWRPRFNSEQAIARAVSEIAEELQARCSS
ncbi:MAG: NAD-dependent epimerase/dehydratase family protein [Bryobacteraceae bacterium]